MIEPYATAIRQERNRFSKLRFRLVSDADYIATFSDAQHTLQISTERYYHPSIFMALCDPDGKPFELGTVQKILAPDLHERKIAVLKDIRQKYGLDQKETPLATRTEGSSEYVRTTLQQVLDFLLAFEDRVFAFDSAFRIEYAKREREILSEIGIK